MLTPSSSRLPLRAIVRCGVLVGCLAAALLVSARLEAASPQFNLITPWGGQRGTELEVELAGCGSAIRRNCFSMSRA